MGRSRKPFTDLSVRGFESLSFRGFSYIRFIISVFAILGQETGTKKRKHEKKTPLQMGLTASLTHSPVLCTEDNKDWYIFRIPS